MPDTWVIRDRSAQSFFSISATWSSGSKSNFGGVALGADDGVEAFVGPDRRAVLGDAGQLQHQRLERGFLARPAAPSSSPALAPASLALRPKLGLLLGRGVLELGADRVALGAQRLDLGLERRALRRRARAARRGRDRPPCRGSRARPSSRLALMKSMPSMARAMREMAGEASVSRAIARRNVPPKRAAMPSGLIALLDDVATIAKLAAASIDDVGAGGRQGGHQGGRRGHRRYRGHPALRRRPVARARAADHRQDRRRAASRTSC